MSRFLPTAALGLIGLVLLASGVRALQIPPPPTHHVDDRAGMVGASTEARLNARLEDFERESSSQIVLSLFRRIPEDTTLEEFTVETAQAWGVGRSGKDNGVVLFVFVDDRKLRIEVGYGLEGAIPDVTARHILDEVVTPALRRGDFDAAMTRAAEALMAAARGEYEGDGRVIGSRHEAPLPPAFIIFVVLVVAIFILHHFLSGVRYTHGRRGTYSSGPFDGGGSWGGGGGFGGGGFGGGGFGGGGGGFGGGGASGGW